MFEIKQKRLVVVEDIQDIIEKELFKARYFDVMKSFILYRHLHKIQREQILQIESDTTYINSTQTIQEYINGNDWRIKANSNTGYSHAGLINNSAGKLIANYWLDKIYTKEQREDSKKSVEYTLTQNGFDMNLLKDVVEIPIYADSSITWGTFFGDNLDEVKTNGWYRWDHKAPPQGTLPSVIG